MDKCREGLVVEEEKSPGCVPFDKLRERGLDLAGVPFDRLRERGLHRTGGPFDRLRERRFLCGPGQRRARLQVGDSAVVTVPEAMRAHATPWSYSDWLTLEKPNACASSLSSHPLTRALGPRTSMAPAAS